jgi:hypothetical protein
LHTNLFQANKISSFFLFAILGLASWQLLGFAIGVSNITIGEISKEGESN